VVKSMNGKRIGITMIVGKVGKRKKD